MELVLFVGGAAVAFTGVTVLLLLLLGTGWEAVVRGAILGAGLGLLGAILNGSRSMAKRENPASRVLIGRILLMALALVPGGAVLGALGGAIYGGSDTGPTVVRVLGHAVGGAAYGGVAAIVTAQVGIAIATVLGRVRHGAWERHLLVEMADSATDLVLYEGGVLLALPGLCIGAIVGIVLALVNLG